MKYTINNPKLVIMCYNPEEDNFTGVVKDRYGNIAYYANSKHHRTDGPAIILHYGREDWFIHGKRHREDGPAIELINGWKRWWYNGECYGYDADFTVKSWIKKCSLEIFK